MRWGQEKLSKRLEVLKESLLVKQHCMLPGTTHADFHSSYVKENSDLT